MSSYPQIRTFVHIVIHISTIPSCLNANMEIDATLCRLHTCHLQPYHVKAHHLFGLHVIAPFKTSCRKDEKRKLTGGRICMNILRTKSIEQSIKDTEEPEFQLRNKNREE